MQWGTGNRSTQHQYISHHYICPLYISLTTIYLPHHYISPSPLYIGALNMGCSLRWGLNRVFLLRARARKDTFQ